MEDKYLTLGSVVMLKGGKKAVMVIGYFPIPKDDQSKMYDYMACLFPEGVLDTDKNIVFNNDDVDQVIFRGLDNEESSTFTEKLSVYKEQILNQNNNN